jgi:uroporphyrinogen decarboxylase
LPERVTPDEYFDFDIIHAGIDPSPRFKPELIGDDGEWRTIRDRFGYVVKMIRGKSRTMHYLSCPAPDRASWEKVKPMFVMKKDEPARIDRTAYPFRLDDGPSWSDAKKVMCELRQTGKYLLATAYGPHEAVWRLHGFTETLYDIILDPGLIREMAEVYIDFLIAVIRRIIDKGIEIDGFMAVEDLASTRGMLFSPDQWRDIYKPQMRKIGAMLKENNLHFWMHCCGNCEAVIEDLIECGLKVINPLEAKSGLDVCVLKDTYGGRLAFYGNLDVIRLAGSSETAMSEIENKLKPFSGEGGYIAHSDHSIPPEISFRRYCEIVEKIRNIHI